MTTLVATLPPGLARAVAVTADWLGLTHSELAIAALRLFISGTRQERLNERTNERTNEATRAPASAPPEVGSPMIASPSPLHATSIERRQRLAACIAHMATAIDAGECRPQWVELEALAQICDDFAMPIEAARVRRWIPSEFRTVAVVAQLRTDDDA